MATGVLPLLLGRLTRLAQFYQGAAKAYQGEIRFGIVTDSYDADGDPVEFVPRCEPSALTLESVRAAAAHFGGRMQQLPPPFSAKKIKGVPAYKLARRKVEVELKPVEVEIEQFVIDSFAADRACFSAVVSAGTYLRAIAHELGQRLGCGAHLSALCRTLCGEFPVADAHSLDDIARRMAGGAGLGDYLIHPRKILPHMPAVTASPEAAARVRNGGAVNLPEMSEAKLVRVFANQSDLLAIASRIAGTLFQPKVVLAGGSKAGNTGHEPG
jgi:tRNA pseudouridine55 synthase